MIPEKAELSSAYIAEKAASIAKENQNALESAREKLEWAVSINAAVLYTAAYQEVEEAYNAALSASESKDWDEAFSECSRAVMITLDIERAWRADEAEKRKAADAAKDAENKKKAEEAAKAVADSAASALAAAKKRVDGVSSADRVTYAAQYKAAGEAYEASVKAQLGKDWTGVTAHVKKVNDAVDQINKLVRRRQRRRGRLMKRRKQARSTR
jgi:colicin import membrane protein